MAQIKHLLKSLEKVALVVLISEIFSLVLMIVGKNLKNQIIDRKYYSSDYYDLSVNKYSVKCGTSLRFWEDKGWINQIDPIDQIDD